MESTPSPVSRIAAADTPQSVQAMVEALQRLGWVPAADTSAAQLVFLKQSSAMGTIPRPAALGGTALTGISQLLDKLGERITFERISMRLYDALLVKYQTCIAADAAPSPIAQALQEINEVSEALGIAYGESPAQTLERWRAEELAHWYMLCESMQQLGGNPGMQTPCAHVMARASSGLIQVVTDPRTTLSQTINVMLTAGLTNTAGWELLRRLAEQAGETGFSERCKHALAQEEQHLSLLGNWMIALLSLENSSSAV